MVREGLRREFARKGDAFHNTVMMALLRKEWPPAQISDLPGASFRRAKGAFLTQRNNRRARGSEETLI